MINSSLSAEKKLFGLDHLRALAITLVFFFHYQSLFKHPKWIETVGSFGWTGVDLFFVLSGYLIASQLFAQVADGRKPSLKEFYTKRLFRIIPAYLVVLAVYFTLPSFREKEALPPLWRFLTFTQNLGLNPKDFGTFSHAWSLCIEEQFYLLLPLIILAFLYFNAGKKAAHFIIALFLLGFVTRIFSYTHFVEPGFKTGAFRLPYFKWVYYPTYNRLDGLLTGISLAGLFQFYPKVKNSVARHGNLLFFTGLLLLGGAYLICLDMFSFAASVFGFPLVSIAFGFMVAAAVSPSSFLYRKGSKITMHIAALSYGIYLSHKIVIHLTQSGKIAAGVNTTWMFLLCIATAWITALLLRYAVEKPFLKLRQMILQKRKAVTGNTIPKILVMTDVKEEVK